MSKEKSENKWQWFLMVILIPAVFAVILAVVLLYYMGFNVGERIEQSASFLPFVESQEDEENENEILREQLIQLEDELTSYQSIISELEYENNQKDQQLAALEEQLSIANENVREADEQPEEVRTDLSDIVRTLEGMSASRAANIFSEMEQEEAVIYLRLMKVDNRSQILSRMDPALAAQLVSLLSN
ncbi:flagellar motility protein MotE (MotC chaperone) [Evansella vedderi]|uniref:Flagellar motility protein MotE (MotC chaperone) n=1 Tax=Evansella vedderi TaxID=38282 RepID=A0ABT9ZR45_9BACI|nr:hypothetical protein [Evansella vedderi]MDQ0253711.1 flagellar motility protein MotE (MotC chaperone) [Evansella vedderi]